MHRITHHFVDADGKTHVDTFNSDLPLDMEAFPEYVVCLNTRCNARLLAELWKECDDGKGQRRLMTGCPADGDRGNGFDKAEDARNAVRRFCFENPHAILGGLREVRDVDYSNACVVAGYAAVHDSITKQMAALPPEQRNTSDALRKAVANAYGDVIQPHTIIATVASHPLWKRMSWINGVEPMVVFNLIGTLVDPTWYINPAHPERSGVFKEACGIYHPSEASQGAHWSTPVWRMLVTPFTLLLYSKFEKKDLETVGAYFLRYGLRKMQQSMDEGAEVNEALNIACWYHNWRLANYVWLNWMEVMHEDCPQCFDDKKFFADEPDVAEASYRAAVS